MCQSMSKYPEGVCLIQGQIMTFVNQQFCKNSIYSGFILKQISSHGRFVKFIYLKQW